MLRYSLPHAARRQHLAVAVITGGDVRRNRLVLMVDLSGYLVRSPQHEITARVGPKRLSSCHSNDAHGFIHVNATLRRKNEEPSRCVGSPSQMQRIRGAVSWI